MITFLPTPHDATDLRPKSGVDEKVRILMHIGKKTTSTQQQIVYVQMLRRRLSERLPARVSVNVCYASQRDHPLRLAHAERKLSFADLRYVALKKASNSEYKNSVRETAFLTI